MTREQPGVDRPQMPAGYGVPESTEGLLSWAQVTDRLTAAAQYWMATTRPDGRPHVVPRWGAWLGGHLWYDGSPETVHVRNLMVDGACALHLEDGWEVVIVEGTSRPSPPPGLDLGARIAAEFTRKYGDKGYAPEAAAWEGPGSGGLLQFTPIKAMAWFDFPKDVTRFSF